ncbi:MAG TPA: CBS domain-containing protein [Euryarchaeota archaeon]|nr:inosine 5'-monophosphate dehydrogenase [archaeon BMS3Abin16]GBE56364.1 inosine 5'-monophosphate dehydrogenase [archaeon BMS3Bbin16]HDH27993.1 CBS domain-containing protein [Euryarchaeota archaeon]
MVGFYVKDVMTPHEKIVGLKEDDTIDDVLKHYKAHYYHSFPVLDGDELKGVLGEDIVLIRLLYDYLDPKDFSLMLGQADIKNIDRYISENVKNISSSPITISPEVKVEDAVALMIKQHVDRIMVTIDDKLVGVLSKRDIIRKMIEHKT